MTMMTSFLKFIIIIFTSGFILFSSTGYSENKKPGLEPMLFNDFKD
jgi:hypothetical protein